MERAHAVEQAAHAHLHVQAARHVEMSIDCQMLVGRSMRR